MLAPSWAPKNVQGHHSALSAPTAFSGQVRSCSSPAHTSMHTLRSEDFANRTMEQWDYKPC